MIQGVFFDLDGTLVIPPPTSAAPSTACWNRHGARRCPSPPCAPTFPAAPAPCCASASASHRKMKAYAEYLERFLTIYQAHICDESTLFPGMDEVLDTLDARRIPWGIVTNKAERFTTPLVARLGLAQRSASSQRRHGRAPQARGGSVAAGR